MAIKSTKDAQRLQQNFDKLAIWEGKWKMAFHPDKLNQALHCHLEEAKYLVLAIGQDLAWKSHVCTKANKRVTFSVEILTSVRRP